MALSATPIQQATANSGGSSVTTLNVVLPSAPTAGNIVLVVGGIVGAFPNSRAINATGISWTMIPWSANNAVCGFLAIGQVHAGASATITVNGNTGGIALVAAEFAGSNIALDQEISVSGGSTSLASGATPTTDVAAELWIGAMIARNSSTFSAPTNGFAIVAQDRSTLGTTADRSVALLAQVVSSTGTANAGVTQSVNGVWIAIAATFYEVTSGGGIVGSLFKNKLLGA